MKKACDSANPKITAGITCYNASDTIKRAVESALAQDWDNLEIVIVDDGSSDGSVEILRTLEQQDERIRVIVHDANKGYPSALNTIIQNAKGDYVAFFDDDDDYLPERIEAQFQRLKAFEEEHSGVPVFCYSHRRVFKDGVEHPEGFVKAIGYESPEPAGSMVADYLLWHKKEDGYSWGEFGSGTLMANAETLKRFQFDPEFRRSAEWDLAIRAALEGAAFISVDRALVDQHKTHTPDKSGRKPLEYTLKLRYKHKCYLKRQGVYLSSLCLARARFAYFTGRVWSSRLFLLLACFFSPFKVLKNEISKRF